MKEKIFIKIVKLGMMWMNGGMFMTRKIAVVTGASSGLGREFVKLLSEKTAIEELWVLARTRSKLEALAAEFSKEIRVFAMDLSDSAEILRFAAVLEKEKPEILYLINNAGFAKFCSYQDCLSKNL